MNSVTTTTSTKMSRLIVRKAFELLDDDLKGAVVKIKKRKHVEVRSKTKPVIKKRPKKDITIPELKKFDIISFPANKKSSIEEYKANQMVDRTEENLKTLLQSKQLMPKSDAAQKILEFHDKEQKKRVIEPEVEIAPEPESILFPELNQIKKKKKQDE